MALELFKPFIYNKLEEKGFVTTIKVCQENGGKRRKKKFGIFWMMS
jgi:DNA-directed RNA polymerase subunit beta'